MDRRKYARFCSKLNISFTSTLFIYNVSLMQFSRIERFMAPEPSDISETSDWRRNFGLPCEPQNLWSHNYDILASSRPDDVACWILRGAVLLLGDNMISQQQFCLYLTSRWNYTTCVIRLSLRTLIGGHALWVERYRRRAAPTPDIVLWYILITAARHAASTGSRVLFSVKRGC